MHALMVLGAVNPLIKVFDDPVEFLDALWLPFRRDHSMIKEALQQHPNVKAIFAHLDVVCISAGTNLPKLLFADGLYFSLASPLLTFCLLNFQVLNKCVSVSMVQVGAYMNESYQAKEGIEPSTFS